MQVQWLLHKIIVSAVIKNDMILTKNLVDISIESELFENNLNLNI